MKKAAIAACLLVAVLCRVSAGIELVEVPTWDEIEKELHGIAKEFVSAKRSGFKADTGVWKYTKAGLLYFMQYQDYSNSYLLILNLKHLEKPEYYIPPTLQNGIITSAAKKFTSLYGEPNIQKYVEAYGEPNNPKFVNTQMQAWENCTSWYTFAAISQSENDVKNIGLAFFEKDL